ncbi:MAG TPA: dienelactone hydrolase family protein [Acidimicrobiia bacterium]|nr:dienelactone hydrolase family protein [Acidimicrobiia bacterium]
MRRLAAFGLLVSVAAVSCGGDNSEGGGGSIAQPVRKDETPAPVDEVVVRTETFVDPSRPTDPPVGAADRTLVTTIRFPESGGPYPLIVLAHGFNGHPRKFDELTDAWARAGYVVAAPAFPLTNDELVGDRVVADYRNQPADVSFVIDALLELSKSKQDPLNGRLDRNRIGVAGLSLGGVTTFGVTYNSCCRDTRIDAAITMAGARFPFDGAYDLVDVPLLLIHGDADPSLAYQGSVDAYAAAAPPKFFVTILGGGHAPPFEDTDDPADEMVTAVTIDFWDLFLAARPGTIDQLVADANVPALSTLQHEAA